MNSSEESKKEKNYSLKFSPNNSVNRKILTHADCLGLTSPVILEFAKRLEQRSHLAKNNPDYLVYEE